MAYVRGAKRHPMFVLTITPEQEAQIESELSAYSWGPRIHDWGNGRPRPPCGTVQGYWSHLNHKEQADPECRAAATAYRTERRRKKANA